MVYNFFVKTFYERVHFRREGVDLRFLAKVLFLIWYKDLILFNIIKIKLLGQNSESDENKFSSGYFFF